MQVTVKTVVALAAATILGIASEAWAVPVVSNVTMAQRPGARLVDINYTLADEAAIVTLSIETNDVAIPDSAVTWLVGDVCKVVQPGNRSIVWNAGADWPENLTDTAKARVTAWSTDAPPAVMVVDLTGGSGASTYPIAYYTSTAAVPGGVTNEIYKSSHLLMTKITKGVFNMGESSTAVAVTLTQDFYIGVYQVTQRQWAQVMGYWSSYFTNEVSRAYRPVETVSYNTIRGATNDSPSVNWPTTDRTVVTPASFVGKLRSKTGQLQFDLPTEAQWEYACRAGTTTIYNDGNWDANVSGTNADANVWMNALGRHKNNGGYPGGTLPDKNSGPEKATAIVGSYIPNHWGLYDMHGNVMEWCLDWFAGTLSSVDDSVGPISGANRVHRGGSLGHPASSATSAARSIAANPANPSVLIGFRLAITVP